MSFDRLLISEIKSRFRRDGQEDVIKIIDEIEHQLLNKKKNTGENIMKEVLASCFSDSGLMKELIDA